MEIHTILSQLDRLFAEKKLSEIEPFLYKKLEEAVLEEDISSGITLMNELIGFFRDTSQYEKAVIFCEKVIRVTKEQGLEGTVPYATTLLNVANAYRAAGKLEESQIHFHSVFLIYDSFLEKHDFRYASLNNNLSLLYQELGDFERSCECLKKALDIVLLYPEAQIELAVTYTNLGMSLLKLNQIEESRKNLNHALSIFERDERKDYHYSAALSAMGEIKYRLGDYKEAVEFYEMALSEIEQNVGKTRAYEITKENLAQAYEKSQEVQTISGLKLAEEFYKSYGCNMIHENFPEYENKIAVGLVGEGSECFGFDDEYSKDHDFGPGFCLWITEETYSEIGEKLQQEYEKLPDDFKGVRRIVTSNGQNRVGVFSIQKFYQKLLGVDHIPKSTWEWLQVDEYKLANATNGCVFKDEEGVFTSLRNQLKQYYPEEVRIRKIAHHAALCGQAGQYNYPRMMRRGEFVSARMALSDFTNNIMILVYLLNKEFAPYGKWMHKGMTHLTKCQELKDTLFVLSQLPLEKKAWEKDKKQVHTTVINTEDKAVSIIEQCVCLILQEMKLQGLTEGEDTYMDHHTNHLMHLLDTKEELVDQIVVLEWEAFDKVKNTGGRAGCQDDWETFQIMRKSQYLTWDKELLISYLDDFLDAQLKGWNLITEKYARMMESTSPEEYKALESSLTVIPEEKKIIMEELIKIQVGWMEEFSQNYPFMAKQARVIHTNEDTFFTTSYETYLRGEMSTYSERTLLLYGRFIVERIKKNENLANLTMNYTAILYGYSTLEEAEKKEEYNVTKRKLS